MNDSNQTIRKVDEVLTQIVKLLDPNILQQFKDYFEKNLLFLCGNKLELTLIVDSSAIISDALTYSKTGKSHLLNLSRSPFLKMLAPMWLKEELERKIPEISKKKGIEENKFRSAVSMLLEKVTLIKNMNETAHKLAFTLVGQRDAKDTPYVALYLSIKSHGILTKDKDIMEIPEIKIWERPETAGRVVSIFEKGAFSFAIVGEGLPLVFRLLYEICALILRSIWEVIKTIGNAVYTLLKKGINTVSKFPDWVKALIGVGAFLLILWDKSREVIINVVQSFVQGIINILKWFYDAIKSILSYVAPLIEVGLTVLTFLFTKIEETIVTYQKIDSQYINASDIK